VPQKNAQKYNICVYFSKCVNFGCPGGGELSPFVSLVFCWCTLWAPRVPPGTPRHAFDLFWTGFVHILNPPGCFVRDFGIHLCTTHSPKSGRVPCQKLPREPRKKNAIALSFEREKPEFRGRGLCAFFLSARWRLLANGKLDIYIYIYILYYMALSHSYNLSVTFLKKSGPGPGHWA
jgi:hypothetical protein